MRELVGVDDRADAADLTAGDIEREHPDHPFLGVEEERPRGAVDLDWTQRHTGDAAAETEPGDHRVGDAAAAAQRARERRRLAAAVAGEVHVASEERLQPGE